MKIQIDTVAKTIKIEEPINLGELTESLERLLPSGLWKEFKLETSIIMWNTTPIIIKDYIPFPYQYPWYVPSAPIIYGTGIDQIKNLVNGTFNIQLEVTN